MNWVEKSLIERSIKESNEALASIYQFRAGRKDEPFTELITELTIELAKLNKKLEYDKV